MMHILLIHQAFVSPEEPGGTRHYELASHLVQRGHQCTIVASDLSYLTGQRALAPESIVTHQNINGVGVLRAYTYPSLHRSFVWRVISFLSFMLTSLWAALQAGPVDLVVGTSPPIFQLVSAWLVAVLRRRPFLLEIRDLWPAFAIGLGVLKNPVLIALSYWLERFLYARATHILVNSPAYVDYLVNKGIPETKISLIANGVDPTMFDPQADGHTIREELALGDKFVVTYAGALGLANDIDTIIRAAVRLREEPTIHFLLVGDGKERSNLERQAHTLALTNVTFTGSRPKTHMPAVLAASNACVATLKNIPMFRTTYPNKVFDYMAAGRPTILAIDGVIRHVIEAAGGGIYVSPGNDVALAAAVRCLHHDRAQSHTMGTAARTYVVAHFNRHQQAEQFIELVQRLLTESKR
jgi:glycosyltransferase involved in cell wall biosynthesis